MAAAKVRHRPPRLAAPKPPSRNRSKRMNNHCENCGAVQVGPLTFAIGAKPGGGALGDAWCVVEGTGRFVCPACYPAEAERAREVIECRAGANRRGI